MCVGIKHNGFVVMSQGKLGSWFSNSKKKSEKELLLDENRQLQNDKKNLQHTVDSFNGEYMKLTIQAQSAKDVALKLLNANDEVQKNLEIAQDELFDSDKKRAALTLLVVQLMKHVKFNDMAPDAAIGVLGLDHMVEDNSDTDLRNWNEQTYKISAAGNINSTALLAGIKFFKDNFIEFFSNNTPLEVKNMIKEEFNSLVKKHEAIRKAAKETKNKKIEEKQEQANKQVEQRKGVRIKKRKKKIRIGELLEQIKNL